MKKFLCLVLTLVMVLSMSVTAFAEDEIKDNHNLDIKVSTVDEIGAYQISPDEIQIFSKEYPNAYFEKKVVLLQSDEFLIKGGKLITSSNDCKVKQFVDRVNENPQQLEEVKMQFAKGSNLIATVEATAYVEETYMDKDGQLVCIDSRLLSYDDLFGENSGIQPLDLDLIGSDGGSKYSLTINLNVYSGSGTERYVLAGTATWREGNVNTGGRPASGDDYIGFTWGGKFDFTKANCIVSQNRNETKLLSATKSDVSPNAGVVWSFPEYKYSLNYGNIYAKTVSAGATLTKSKLTGGANTTGVVLKYIHTYEKTKGSISFGASATGGVASFSLSGVQDQWSIAANVNKLKY